MRLELIAKHQTVGIWDGWNHRAFASTSRGQGGWYMVCVRYGDRRRIAPAPKSRTKRPRWWAWRRAEVLRTFKKHIANLQTRQASRERQAA